MYYIYIYILSSSWTVKSQKFYCLRTNSTTRLCLFVIVDYSFGQPCGFRGLFSICVCVLCTRFPLFLPLLHPAELLWSFWEMSNFVVNHFGGSDIELEAISCPTLQYNYVQHYRCFAGFCNINHSTTHFILISSHFSAFFCNLVKCFQKHFLKNIRNLTNLNKI